MAWPRKPFPRNEYLRYEWHEDISHLRKDGMASKAKPKTKLNLAYFNSEQQKESELNSSKH